MSLVQTQLLDMRQRSGLDKNEYRWSRYGALDRFMEDTDNPNGIITPELQAAANASIGRNIDVPVIDYDTGVNILNVRNVVIPDNNNTSKLVRITFATYAFEFTTIPVAHQNNEISLQLDFEKKMRKHTQKLAETLDTAAIAALEAAKTQVAPDLLGLYTFAGDVVIAPNALYDQLIGDIDPMMSSLDYFGMKHLISNVGMTSRIKKMGEYGFYNQQDKTGQYVDKRLSQSNRIANAAGHVATAYSVEDGNLGLLKRFEREALVGTRSRTGHEWNRVMIPDLELEMASYYYESVGDYNAAYGAATADMDRVMKRHYGFAVDLAFVTPYSSDIATIPTPILKVAVAS